MTAALRRFEQLQRRSERLPAEAAVTLVEAIRDLQDALDELHVSRECLADQRLLLAAVRTRLDEERQRHSVLFDAAPDAYLVTDIAGTILEANRTAAELFNTSQRSLAGKSFSVFLCRDRDVIMHRASDLARAGGAARWTVDIRPRERAPLSVVARVAAHAEAAAVMLQWTIRPPRVDATVHASAGSSES